MAHKHAKEMMEYAEDAAKHDMPWELWECSIPGLDMWQGCISEPDWSGVLNYRRKRQFIMINGHKVPEPVDRVEMGQKYYVASIAVLKYYFECVWDGDEYDIRDIDRGLVHLSKENARLHGMALVSFTQKEEK